MTKLTAADVERARTWTVEICDALFDKARRRDEGTHYRYLGQGGLRVRKTDGAWFHHSSGRGSLDSPVGVVAIGKECSEGEAKTWVAAWLTNHQGFGSCDGAVVDDGDDGDPASAAQARAFLDVMTDVIGTSNEAYLKSRRLDPPFPATGHIPYARCGETGLAGILTSHGRVAGLQVLYTAEGQKSTVTPQRRRLMLEKASDAIFEMPYEGDSTDIVVAEGLEDALSVYRYGKRRCRVVGLPGVGTLKNLKFAPDIRIFIRIFIARDGDLPGSAADKALQEGIDHLILSGCKVFATLRPPDGWDANKILEEYGVEKLVEWLDKTEPATLSDNGEIERLAKLSPLDYARVRKDVAKTLGPKGIPVAILDKEVEKARARIAAAAKAAKAEEEWADIQDTPIYFTAIDGAELLHELVETLGAYVIMTETQRWAVALWILFAHCFSVARWATKLWIKSAERRSGKTRLIEVLKHLTPRALVINYITSAMLVRVIKKCQPTLLLDEIDTYVTGDENMRNILNSGFDPHTTIFIGVKKGEADWDPTPFCPWCPQVLAGVGDKTLADTTIDRCVPIELVRKLRSVKVKRLRDQDVGPLQILGQKCARWAEDNAAGLAEAYPEMPSALNDRAADAWQLIVAIGDRAGPEWGQRARKASLATCGDDISPTSDSEQVLSDMRETFEEMVPVPKKDQRISSADATARLNAPQFCRSVSLTQASLASVLSKYHITPQQMKFGRTNVRGYRRSQFEDAWSRYLPPLREGARRTGCLYLY